MSSITDATTTPTAMFDSIGSESTLNPSALVEESAFPIVLVAGIAGGVLCLLLWCVAGICVMRRRKGDGQRPRSDSVDSGGGYELQQASSLPVPDNLSHSQYQSFGLREEQEQIYDIGDLDVDSGNNQSQSAYTDLPASASYGGAEWTT